MAVMQHRRLKKLQFDDFRLGGQLLLWGTRHWMQAYRSGGMMISPCVSQCFTAANLVRVYTELWGLLAIVAFREFPADEFSPPDSKGLTATESRLMEVLTATEQADTGALTRILEGLASPAVARAIVGKAVLLLAHLKKNGHRILEEPAAVDARLVLHDAS